MKVILSPLAEKNFKKLPKITQIVFARKIRQLSQNHESVSKISLTGYKNVFKIRVGDYRLIYKRFTNQRYVITIDHRSRVYKILNRLLR
jgi:mRNA interferase RelE/StbE